MVSRCLRDPDDAQGIDEVDLLGYGTADDRHVETRHGVLLVLYSRRPEGPAFYVGPGWDMGATLIAVVSLCVESVWPGAMGEPSIHHAVANLLKPMVCRNLTSFVRDEPEGLPE